MFEGALPMQFGIHLCDGLNEHVAKHTVLIIDQKPMATTAMDDLCFFVMSGCDASLSFDQWMMSSAIEECIIASLCQRHHVLRLL